jgi:hypothetical protein
MGGIGPIADPGGPFSAILIGRVGGDYPSDSEDRSKQTKLMGAPD